MEYWNIATDSMYLVNLEVPKSCSGHKLTFADLQEVVQVSSIDHYLHNPTLSSWTARAVVCQEDCCHNIAFVNSVEVEVIGLIVQIEYLA